MATRWGIVSAGKICHDFVTAVQSIPGGEHEVVAIGARNLASAEEFAKNNSIPKAYGSYKELAEDPDVEVVYIGNLNPQHMEVGKQMLENGKHVLLEKSMTMNAKQTKDLIETARKHKRFLMEAMWSRFLPSYKYLKEVVRSGSIGEVVHVNADFGIQLTSVDRLMKKSLGGGTMLDLGIYCLNAITMMMDSEKPLKIAAVGHMNEEGVDIAVSSSFLYSKNRTASLNTNAMAENACEVVIIGTKGIIKIPKPFWCSTSIIVGDKTHDFPLPETVRPCVYVNSSGLRFEAMEVRECLKRGALESSILPLKDSELMAEMSDEIRRQVGVVYDADN